MSEGRVEVLTREEANALIKAILYLKFDCREHESLLYAGSPLINTSLDKLVAMHGYESDWGKVFATLPAAYEQLVERKIESSEKESGGVYDDDVRQLVKAYCLHPYLY
ncbi:MULTISPECIES: hypothetical protein [Pseudomonas]|jgi:hypothetical protein|uniref:Uncharacterized protein n=1 Tax=Pseudomonas mosselii TaxID=78327 RepID=A0A5R8Z072_9PSED|nr:hypothetical protein [Pseudomonas mosselii]TLP59149.1 hypothetical protein FEM01_14720 [Pseudomonas mosselii]